MPPAHVEGKGSWDKENAFLHDSALRVPSDNSGRQPFSCKTQPCQNLQGSSEVEARREQAKKVFEEKLASGGGSDIVETWCDYVTWAAQWKEEGMDFEQDAKRINKRACMSLAAKPEHRDDVRHLRLWVRHASNVDEPEKVFEIVESQSIGIGHALLYEAWAASSEKKHMFDAAEDVYQRGLSRGAQPLDRLKSRYEDFRKRQRRRAKRHGSSAAQQPQRAAQELVSEPVVEETELPEVFTGELQTQSTMLPITIEHTGYQESPCDFKERPGSKIVESSHPQKQDIEPSRLAFISGDEALASTPELASSSQEVPLNEIAPGERMNAGPLPLRSYLEELMSEAGTMDATAIRGASPSSSETATRRRHAAAEDAVDPHTWSFPKKREYFDNGVPSWHDAGGSQQHIQEAAAASSILPGTLRSQGSDADIAPIANAVPAAIASEEGEEVQQAHEHGLADSGELLQPNKAPLVFGPQDPSKEHASKSCRSRRSRASRASGEDISVEELRVQWMHARLNVTQEGEVHPVFNDIQEMPEERHADTQRLSGISAASMDVISLASSRSRGVDTHNECTGFTQEVTTSCVERLLGDSRPSLASSMASRPSVASSAFEEPTYTMQEVQREVLSLFSSDSSKEQASDPTVSPVGALGSFLGLSAAESDFVPEIIGGPLGNLPCLNQDLAAQSSSFEIFQETDLDQGGAGDGASAIVGLRERC